MDKKTKTVKNTDKTVTVIATGDSLFTADFPKEYEDIRKTLDEFIGSADVKITNLETNVSDFGDFPNQYSGGTWINVRKELFKYLKTFGFDFYGTANNHCMDYSYHGLLSTIDFLDEEKVLHAGTGRSLEEAGKPAVLPLSGGRSAAIIAVDTSFDPPSMAGKTSNVFKARPGVNYLRHETAYKVDEKDIETLKEIAEKTNINFTRNLSVATGFALPDKDGTFNFGGKLFTTDRNAPSTVCNKKDLARITETVKAAKSEHDYVFVQVHCHDNDGKSHANPPEYLTEFCHAVIDVGADAVFGGGCHELRGAEIYKNKPVFYSLGDFIYQGMRVEYLPPDFMEKYGVDINATAAEGLSARSRGGKIGLQTQEKNFLTVLPKLTFEKGQITDITLMPVKLGFNTGNERLDGLPYFAKGEEAEKIYGIYKTLSSAFGTRTELKDGYVKVKI